MRLFNRLCYGMAVALGALCSTRCAAAAPIVAAVHAVPADSDNWFYTGAGMSYDPPGGVFDNRQGQTFTPLVGGYLFNVSFISLRSTQTNAPLRVSVTAMNGSQPGAVLASTTLTANRFTTTTPTTPGPFNIIADFGLQKIPLVAQTSYALIFSTDTVEGNYGIVGDVSGYPGGNRLFSQNGAPYSTRFGQDFFFQTTITAVPARAGDANLDTFVDAADYTVWADHYLKTDQSWITGDFTGDGVVDGADYTVWADNFLTPSAGSFNAVPEPDALALSASGIAMLCVGARRRRSNAAGDPV